jgi:hypothetical protein
MQKLKFPKYRIVKGKKSKLFRVQIKLNADEDWIYLEKHQNPRYELIYTYPTRKHAQNVIRTTLSIELAAADIWEPIDVQS